MKWTNKEKTILWCGLSTIAFINLIINLFVHFAWGWFTLVLLSWYIITIATTSNYWGEWLLEKEKHPEDWEYRHAKIDRDYMEGKL